MAAGGIAVSSGKLKNITEGGAGNAAVSKELQQNPNQNAPFWLFLALLVWLSESIAHENIVFCMSEDPLFNKRSKFKLTPAYKLHYFKMVTCSRIDLL